MCFFHSPKSGKARRDARKRGGRARARLILTLPPDTPDLPLRTVADVLAALAETFNGVRVGRLDCRVGNCLGQLASVLLSGLKAGALEERMERIEQLLGARDAGGTK